MLNEKKLSKAELDKREDIIMKMKKNKSALVKKYGKDAEKVMYGRATNIAKKQAESMENTKIKEMIKSALMGPMVDPEVGEDRYREEQDLATVSHALDQLEAKLKAHDWYYMMSDDHRVYTNGRHEQSEIRSIMDDLEGLGYGKDAKDLYNQYAPHQEGGPSFRMKEAKGKDMDKDGDIDSDDYMAAKDAAIKKAKGEVKEGFYGSSDIEDVTNALGYSDPYEFFQDNPGAINALMDWVESVPEFRDMLKDADLLQEGASIEEKRIAMRAIRSIAKYRGVSVDIARDDLIRAANEIGDLKEDLDLGHQDDEPHMLKADLYRIGKYAMELYQMVDRFEEGSEEVDFPHWWQSKIIRAKDMLVGAKHYLDFEIKEPQIDAMVDVAAEEDVVDEPLNEGVWSLGTSQEIKDAIHTLETWYESDARQISALFDDKDNSNWFYNVVGDDLFHDYLNRVETAAASDNTDGAHNAVGDAIGRAEELLAFVQKREGLNEEAPGEADMVASDIQKAMNAVKGDESKTHQLKQARTAMNKGDLDKAKKIADRIAKQLKSK